MSDGQNEFGPGLQTLNGRGRGILTLRRVGNKMGPCECAALWITGAGGCLTFQLGGDFSHVFALITGNGQLFVTRLPRTVGAGDGGGAIRSAASHLRNVKQLLRRIADRYDDETVVRQRGPGRTDGVFLAAAGAGGGEDAAYLAVQRAGSPQPAGLIEEGAHLPGHIAEAGWRC